MPSPIGHALGGLAAGWLVAGPPAGRRPPGRSPALPRTSATLRALAFAGLGMAADLDLLLGRHSQFTHSVGMTLGVGVLAFALLQRSRHAARRTPDGTRHPAPGTSHGTPHLAPRTSDFSPVVLAAAAAAAYGSHVLLDWLAQDATPPIGITALWPFTSAYYLSHVDLFWGISREPWRPGAAWHDMLAVSRELLLLGPPAFAAWWLRGRVKRHNLPPAATAGRQPLPSSPQREADGESRHAI